MDNRTREFLQGYGAALADLQRLDWRNCRVVVAALEAAGLTYHDLKDAGVPTEDLGAIARARISVASKGARVPTAAKRG